MKASFVSENLFENINQYFQSEKITPEEFKALVAELMSWKNKVRAV